MDVKADLPTEQNPSHLDGIGASLRQVIAAHFLKDCDHVVEIGGHVRPITGFLTHSPRSVTSIDPKTAPLAVDMLNGRPCRIRHIASKFQDIDLDLAPRSYGLVLLGYALRPLGQREPLGERLFSLIDNAKVIVLEYSPALERASTQVTYIIGRKSLKIVTSLELRLSDPEIAYTPYAERRLYVLDQIDAF